jgi:hypothetical protein
MARGVHRAAKQNHLERQIAFKLFQTGPNFSKSWICRACRFVQVNASLVSQRFHGIDASGAARWNKTGNGGYSR